MKWIKSISLIIFMLFLAGLSSRLMAQGRGMHQNGMGMHEQRAKNLENLRLLKLMEVLNLSDEQSPKFIEAYASFRKDSRQINDNIQSAVDSLAGYLASPNINNDLITKSISQITSLKAQREQRLTEFHKKIEGFLTTEQMGKLVVFEERFERELIENVRGFRLGQKAPMNPGEE
jgi:Spy/CpxP family protein refolding chaperone